jgi:hypothetical protein
VQVLFSALRVGRSLSLDDRWMEMMIEERSSSSNFNFLHVHEEYVPRAYCSN